MLPGQSRASNCWIASPDIRTSFLSCSPEYRRRKEPDERHDVLAMFAQGRNVDPDDVETIEQILAEPLVPDHLLDVRVRGGHDAHVHLGGSRLADGLDFLVLDQSQQLGLDVCVELADLVQEYGAGRGRCE